MWIIIFSQQNNGLYLLLGVTENFQWNCLDFRLDKWEKKFSQKKNKNKFVCTSEIIFRGKIMVFVCFWRDRKFSARLFRFSVRILEIEIFIEKIKTNFLEIIVCKKLMVVVRFWEWKKVFCQILKIFVRLFETKIFTEKKQKLLYDQMQLWPLVPIKKNVPPYFL